MKRKNAATCCGGLGACVCTASMMLPVIIGTAGAGMSTMSGMSVSNTAAGPWAFINAINAIGQPLLIASIALILYGMRNFGKLPFGIVALGGILLYASMYLLNMSVPMIVISVIILAVAYGIAYAPLIKRNKRLQIRSPRDRN